MGEYKKIKHILQEGILLEDKRTIQDKIIELSKIHDVEAMKILYMMIKEQVITCKDGEYYIPISLDYQSADDKSSICINLTNNTIKQAYRLLNWLILSFDVNPNLKDDKNNSMYGYLMANLLGIYKANNNFHSRYDLEKVIVKLSKRICQLYDIDIYDFCYQTSNGKQKTYLDLVYQYKKKNPYFLDKKHKMGTMEEILETLQTEEITTEILSSECTRIRNIDSYQYDERFSKKKRYTKRTLDFVKRNL